MSHTALKTVRFSTCFLTVEEFINGAVIQLSDVLKLLDQISLQCQDIRKVLHQSELWLLKNKINPLFRVSLVKCTNEQVKPVSHITFYTCLFSRFQDSFSGILNDFWSPWSF